ncbi:hypothetical protein NB037_18490, partial [Rathayibacter sp. ZW T2_19]|nr:hypothetical protein [Rathayibacter rubneri]
MTHQEGRRGRLGTVLVLALVAAAFTAPGSAALAPASAASAAGDTVKPIVSFLAPTRGSVLSGTTVFQASAKDDVAVTQLSFWEGAKRLGYGVAGADGWTLPVDTRSFPEGSHVFVAKARDAAGNIGSSASVTVTVSQAAAPAAPTPSAPAPTPSAPAPDPSASEPTTTPAPPTATPSPPAASPTAPAPSATAPAPPVASPTPTSAAPTPSASPLPTTGPP